MIKVTISAEDHLKDKIVEVLNELQQEGLSYNIEANTFEQNQKELQESLKNISANNAKTYTLEEADSILEEAITHYEDKASR